MRIASLSLLSFALILLLGAMPPSGHAGDQPAISGEATVLSGESLQIDGRRLRLAGIDAPDLTQQCLIGERLYPCGEVSKTALMDLTAGALVVCQRLTHTGNSKDLAYCSADGYDLSEGMVYTGWAMADPATGARYARLQDQAQAKGRGLWRGTFVMPWDWRSGQRLAAESQ